MDYYCDVCDKLIKPKSNFKNFKPNTHEKFDICKRMELANENPAINKVREVFYAYIIQHERENIYYLIKCHFKLVFNNNQYRTYVKSNLFDNKTMISWQNFV